MEARGRKDIGDSSRPRTRKAWEISSDEEEDYKPRPRNTKLTSLLSDEDDDIYPCFQDNKETY